MKECKKKRIAVFFGGCSSEYDVSLQSAYSVITHIDKEIYRLVLVGIHPETGEWYWYQGDSEAIPKNKWFSENKCISVFPSVDKSVHGLCYSKNKELQTLSLDAAFPVLHGKNGEDGTVQGILELAGIPIIGCGTLSSALCMDKELAHRIVEVEGIKSARCTTITEPYDESDIKEAALEIGYPLFVKPVRAGSSFGITKIYEEKELFSAVSLAFTYDTMVILEKMVPGFEVGCAVLETGKLLTGEIDEIELSEGFFDFKEKYTLQTSRIHVPARISAEAAEKIKRTAIRIYQALKCSCFARVDMFLTPDGEIYFNEVNTIPGFTSQSRYANMLQAAGLSFTEVINQLLQARV